MKFVASLAVLTLVAGSASATIMLGSGAAFATPLGTPPPGGHTRAVSSVYDSIPGPYSAFAAATGLAATDDYTSTQAAPFNLAQFKFVGGVTTAGQGLTVAFFDTAMAPVNSFHVNLPSAGDFIWTIRLGAAPNGGDSTFGIAQAGSVTITIDPTTTGRWFFTTTAPSIGSNDITVGTGGTLSPQRYNAYGLVMVPAPGALALLGLGGLVATRRRR